MMRQPACFVIPSSFHVFIWGLRFAQCIGSRYGSLHPNHWSLASPGLVPATALLRGRDPGPPPTRAAPARACSCFVIFFNLTSHLSPITSHFSPLTIPPLSPLTNHLSLFGPAPPLTSAV